MASNNMIVEYFMHVWPVLTIGRYLYYDSGDRLRTLFNDRHLVYVLSTYSSVLMTSSSVFKMLLCWNEKKRQSSIERRQTSRTYNFTARHCCYSVDVKVVVRLIAFHVRFVTDRRGQNAQFRVDNETVCYAKSRTVTKERNTGTPQCRPISVNLNFPRHHHDHHVK